MTSAFAHQDINPHIMKSYLVSEYLIQDCGERGFLGWWLLRVDVLRQGSKRYVGFGGRGFGIEEAVHD